MSKTLIRVSQAQNIIAKFVNAASVQNCRLSESLGKILKEDIYADRPQPAFDKVLMDGIAIHFEAWKNGQKDFSIEGIQSAGTQALTLRNKAGCIEVMTGCVLPINCDCVIPFEQVTVSENKTVYRVAAAAKVSAFQNILKIGSDYKEGQKLLAKGIQLSPCAVAVLAAVGKKHMLVSRPPLIAIVSTGDELVDVGGAVKPYQIRTSNSHALAAAIQKFGVGQARAFHIKDDRPKLLSGLKSMLRKFDVIILSGGVSMGKFDYVPGVLDELGVGVQFHKVRQKPGKPFWFGTKRKGPVVFALPGNPASTMVCFYRYVLPFLFQSMGDVSQKSEFVVLGRDIEVSRALTSFLPVKVVSSTDARSIAEPVRHSGSGDYLALGNSDGFIELPIGEGKFKKNTVCRFYRW